MSVLATRARRETPLTDVAALVDQVVTDLNDRRFLGRTSAREVAAGNHWPFAVAPAWLDLDGDRVDDDGIPLAWSCWEMATALADRLHSEGVYAGVQAAFGCEDGATGEPHAVTVLEGLNGERYLADPYFGVGAVLLDDWQDHLWTGRHATATTHGGALQRTSTEFTIRHAAFPRPYRYQLSNNTGFLETYTLINDAPRWVGADGPRSLRTTVDDVVLRVTEKADHVETKVWDLPTCGTDPTLSWASPTWMDAATFVVDLTQLEDVSIDDVRRLRTAQDRASGSAGHATP